MGDRAEWEVVAQLGEWSWRAWEGEETPMRRMRSPSCEVHRVNLKEGKRDCGRRGTYDSEWCPISHSPGESSSSDDKGRAENGGSEPSAQE